MLRRFGRRCVACLRIGDRERGLVDDEGLEWADLGNAPVYSSKVLTSRRGSELLVACRCGDAGPRLCGLHTSLRRCVASPERKLVLGR